MSLMIEHFGASLLPVYFYFKIFLGRKSKRLSLLYKSCDQHLLSSFVFTTFLLLLFSLYQALSKSLIFLFPKSEMAPKTKRSVDAPKQPTPLSHNTLQVNFDSVFSLEMPSFIAMFRSLEASGLRRFLGRSSMLFEADVRTFFQNASMDGSSIVSSVKGSDILITETLFSTFFELPSEGLTSFSEIPIDTYSATISSFSFWVLHPS